MSKNLLCPSASLRGVSKANDEANQLTEFRRGQSTSVTTLTGFATLNRLGCRPHIRSLAMTQCAFTMAQILLSLTIIGVVAAITLPSLMANINERTWNTQRKALYARMSQAIAMLPQVGGYGTLTEDESGSVTADTAAEAFLTEGLSKVLKINNICDSEHLSDCGLPAKINALDGSVAFEEFPKTLLALNPFFNFSKSYDTDGDGVKDWSPSHSQIDTKVACFETQNGESIALFYNPNCKNYEASIPVTKAFQAQPFLCANFLYDLNGNKGPNTVGKDIGYVTAINSINTSVVAPLLLLPGNTGLIGLNEAHSACLALGEDVRLPNLEELFAIFYNVDLIGDDFPRNDTWSLTRYSTDKVMYMFLAAGSVNIKSMSTGESVAMCVKR